MPNKLPTQRSIRIPLVIFACQCAALCCMWLYIYLSWNGLARAIVKDAWGLSIKLSPSGIQPVGIIALAIALVIKWWRQGWHEMRAHWAKHILESLVPAVSAVGLIFLYNALVVVPNRIRRTADEIRIPIPQPPQPYIPIATLSQHGSPQNPTHPPYAVKFNFRVSPYFTAKRIYNIKNTVNELYLYLTAIGFELQSETPMLGARNSNVMTEAWMFPGAVYNRWLDFPGKHLDSEEAIREVYANYVVRQLFGIPANNGTGHSFNYTCAAIYAAYYSARLNHKLPVRYKTDNTWIGSKWVARAWELQSTCGNNVGDKGLYYTLKMWPTWPQPQQKDSDFDAFFRGRFIYGCAVYDNTDHGVECVEKVMNKY